MVLFQVLVLQALQLPPLFLNKLEQSSEETVVLAENERVLIATFHPELTEDNLVHRYFVDKVLKTAN